MPGPHARHKALLIQTSLGAAESTGPFAPLVSLLSDPLTDGERGRGKGLIAVKLRVGNGRLVHFRRLVDDDVDGRCSGRRVGGGVLGIVCLDVVLVGRGGGPDQGEDYWEEHETVEGSKEADTEKLAEKQHKNVALGGGHDNDGEESGENAVHDVGSHLSQRLYDALIVCAGGLHESVANVRRVVDSETDGEDEVDDGDGVDRHVPEPHQADDVEENHDDGDAHEEAGPTAMPGSRG